MNSNVGPNINDLVNVGILTISDRCYQGLAEDTSGPALVASVKSLLPSCFRVGLIKVDRPVASTYKAFNHPLYFDMLISFCYVQNR